MRPAMRRRSSFCRPVSPIRRRVGHGCVARRRGRLYTFYKAATAVVWARVLEREAGIRCVPLFWLQSEDHDFPEIACCRVRGPGGAVYEPAMAAGGTSA